ncbi:hypothetical protein [Streptomyces niveus]|uniref:hypothetical protein n=1 Tax=Streptomyces niveus TaxID=193462 RepID=UPI000B16C7D7|nr:hypothetical protein [Streptomyces niveus]
MTIELAGDVTMLAVAVRVFGRDAVVLLRRMAAAGVRAGVMELNRHHHEEGGGR